MQGDSQIVFSVRIPILEPEFLRVERNKDTQFQIRQRMRTKVSHLQERTGRRAGIGFRYVFQHELVMPLVYSKRDYLRRFQCRVHHSNANARVSRFFGSFCTGIAAP